MKLIFRKNEAENINIFIRREEKDEEFSYIKMISLLIQDNKFEDSEFEDDCVAEQERESITEMLRKINSAVVEKLPEEENV